MLDLKYKDALASGTLASTTTTPRLVIVNGATYKNIKNSWALIFTYLFIHLNRIIHIFVK